MDSEEQLGTPEKPPCCGRCRNHRYPDVPLKGHKRICPFMECKGVTCEGEYCGCQLIGERTGINKEAKALYPADIDVVTVDDVEKGKRISVKTCRLCRAHGKDQLSKGHKSQCPYPYKLNDPKCGAKCAKCKIVVGSRVNQSKQRKVERRKPHERVRLSQKKPNCAAVLKPTPVYSDTLTVTNFHDNLNLPHNIGGPMPPYNSQFQQAFGQRIPHNTTLPSYAIYFGPIFPIDKLN